MDFKIAHVAHVIFTLYYYPTIIYPTKTKSSLIHVLFSLKIILTCTSLHYDTITSIGRHCSLEGGNGLSITHRNKPIIINVSYLSFILLSSLYLYKDRVLNIRGESGCHGRQVAGPWSKNSASLRYQGLKLSRPKYILQNLKILNSLNLCMPL